MEEKKALITLIGGVLAGHDPELAQELLNAEGLLPATFEVLQADTTDGEAGAGALSILDGLGASDKLRAKWDKATGDTKLMDLADATIQNMQLNNENPEAIAAALNAFCGLVNPGKDAAVKKLLMNAGVQAICQKHEGHPAVRKAQARLSSTLPPVGGEMYDAIAACIAADEAEDNSGVSKNLGVIVTGLRAPIEDPDTNLERMPELLEILNRRLVENSSENVQKNIAGIGSKVMQLLAFKYADEDSPHGHRAICESGCSEGLLLITAKKSVFSSRGATVKNAADTMAMMAEDLETRETFLEAHANCMVYPEIMEDFENEPDVRKSITNLLWKIIDGPGSPHLTKCLQDMAWKNKVLEILLGQIKGGVMDGARMRMLLNTLAAMDVMMKGDMTGTPEGVLMLELCAPLCKVMDDAEKLEPEMDGPIMDHIGSILRMPNAREEAYKELQSASRLIVSLDCSPPFRGRYFVHLKDILMEGYMADVIKFKLDQTFGEVIENHPQDIGVICEILKMEMETPEGMAHALNLIETQEILEKIFQPGTDDPPPIFSDPEGLNSVLEMLGVALEDEEFRQKLAMREDILGRIAEIPVNAETNVSSHF
eukprot:Gregarina_sp_Poly_1__4812@NODE_2566_length_1974_cov_4_913477_g1623_i1_p1_GENE_NODE_2566_length_1974_cov_4_913477_g1623_i1NODE_2566_length_1974_cov_4_913477_g1623_i1_p1_ORF_typecomplete_len619_score132_54CBM_15/PF03426_14/0_22Npa1/PF11707_8/15Npa1/PF11707_8/3e03Npa1/PF11707_8/1_4e03Npa1/PF11707_8/1_6e02_NODE_2566_length_1974_cov_4_913477_g1623_i11181914